MTIETIHLTRHHPSEWETKLKKKTRKVEEILGMAGRCLGSKSGYCFTHPNNLVVFNSNLFIKNGKVWHGDLDITVNLEDLKKVTKYLKETIYILYESDGRSFGIESERYKETSPNLTRAVISIDKNGNVEIGDINKDHYEMRLVTKEREKEEEELPEYNKDHHFIEKDFDAYPISIWRFASRIKKSPLEKFVEYVMNLGLDSKERELSVNNIYLSPQNYKVLKKLMKRWFEDYHHLSEYGLQREMTWLGFSMPSEFSGSYYGPKWLKEKTFYVKKPDSKKAAKEKIKKSDT